MQWNPWNWESLGDCYLFFPQSTGTFLPSDSHPMYFMTWEMHGFPHQFPIAWENAAKSIKLGELGRLVPIFPLKYGYFSSIRFPSYGILYHMKNAWLFPSIAWENTAKSTLWAHRLFFHSIIVLTHSKIWWFLKRTNRKNQLGKLCFLKKKNQFQARWNLKQNISKEGEGMDVISSNKRNINIYYAQVSQPT